ncbi:Ig-like domain-containing protein [Agathobacter rectalis]|uniref:Ig-like domain-containing protein n=1 Tax=Agathobacter rectalis TaxID=39491 RepID=UPI0021FEC8F8|nr:Ig-like domain-containing protein [Agathobacter rectalis]UTB43658.1 Ig-like domain-containing protein [Agathobacter rectalis]
MTIEEALEASAVELVNDIFLINPESRVITVPESEKIFGVYNDGNTERKHFRCPKIVGDNIDLSAMHLYINYQNANGQKYPYLIEDVQTDGDYITFSWLIGPDVVAYKGQVKFILCAKKDANLEWNTTLAEGTVLEGLEATDEVVDRNPDIIEQILTRLDNVTEIPQEKVSSAVEEYMAKNPINIPESPYKGKTIVAFGDSIIAGWGWREGTGIVQPLKEKYPDGIWINNAESGANIAISNSPAHTPIISQIRSYTGQPDAIIFDGGVNDLNNNIAMGNISDSYDSNYDTTTICGAMESALQYVMDTFPLAVKLYIIPHSFSKNNYVDSVHEKMIEICKKWNMPYLDMRKCAQIAMTSKNKSKYTRNANTGVGDGVHPTETWYRKFYAPLVDRRLRDLGIGYTESVAPATVPVTGVTLDKSTLSMQVGDSQKLTSTVKPSTATNQSVKWLASNDNITVSNGTVTAKSTGRAVVTVQTDDGGYTATCDVTIQKKVPEIVPVTGVELNKSQMTLEVDSSVTLIATVKPSTATNQSVKWSVNNSNVIVQNGTVTAKTVGTSIVTVTTNDGNHKAQCTVEVIAKQVQPSEPHTNIGGLNIDGNCYFDTEVLPDQNTNTDIRLYVKSNSTYICGARDDNYKYGFTKTDNFYAIRGTVSSSAKPCTFWEDTWTIKQTGATASFNNNAVELDPIDSFTLTSPYYIGTMSKNGASAGAGMVGAIIYAKIYSGSELVADMIPVKKADGTLCLYDEIRKKYLYNKGSGAVTELK